MDLLIDILVLALILGAFAVIALVPFALSYLYIIWGRMVNNTFMIVLFNGGLWAIRLKSETASFRGGDDPVKRWDVREGYPDPENNAGALPLIGLIPYLFYAQRVSIPINFINVIRPQRDTEGARIIYQLIPHTIRTRNPQRIIVHGFETTPVETRGGGKKMRGEDGGFLVAIVTEVLQVTFEIENPYLAFVRIVEDGTAIGQVGQKFMTNVNGTLQSVAREVTALFTYSQLIRAQVEEDADKNSSGKSLTVRQIQEREERNRLRVRFGKEFKRRANKSLKPYGIKILDVDMLDHSLEKEMAKDLQRPQKAAFMAQEMEILGKGERKQKEQVAIGDAAEMRELLKAAGGDKDLVREEIRRRGKERAAEKVGENFDGQYLSVNLGDGGNTAMPPQPSVLGGSVGFKTPTKEKQEA